ncbi:hypothetical protein ACFQ60_06245 [Streptomyces zhihengii]
MDLFSLPRLGVVVPPENPTAEPEFNHLLGTGLNVYTARFPTTPGLGLRRMLETYNEVLPDTLGDFGGLRLDATVVACSASHYLLDPAGDRAFCEELSVRVRHPVRSSTQAVLAACEALGVSRLTLVSPYEPWLTDVSRAYWERAGLTVDGVVLVPAGRTPRVRSTTTRTPWDCRACANASAPTWADGARPWTARCCSPVRGWPPSPHSTNSPARSRPGCC